MVALALVLWVLPFEWLERVFGYGGLCLLVFAVAAIKLHPDWGAVAHGFVPQHRTRETSASTSTSSSACSAPR